MTAKSAVAGLGNVHPKTGELVHAGQAVPAALRAIVLGTQSVSTFAELGLAESLATHLEGTCSCLLPWKPHDIVRRLVH